MKSIRLFISVLFSLFFIFGCKGQDIIAILNYSDAETNKYKLKLTLINETRFSYYMVGVLNNLTFKDFSQTKANFGSAEKDYKSRYYEYLSFTDDNGAFNDTVNLTLPVTEDRYQLVNNDTIDVFNILTSLNQMYLIQQNDSIYSIPIPEHLDTLIKYSFVDEDLYHLMKANNLNRCSGCFFPEQTIILKPYEKKKILIDLSYLSMYKVNYRINFRYSGNNNLEEETRFLEKLGYKRFNGKITSNNLILEYAK